VAVEKRLATNKHGELVLTVKASSPGDIYRLARHLEHGQVEFARLGRNALSSLRRQLGPQHWRDLVRYMEGDGR